MRDWLIYQFEKYWETRLRFRASRFVGKPETPVFRISLRLQTPSPYKNLDAIRN
jgi:hypothetical protein